MVTRGLPQWKKWVFCIGLILNSAFAYSDCHDYRSIDQRESGNASAQCKKSNLGFDLNGKTKSFSEPYECSMSSKEDEREKGVELQEKIMLDALNASEGTSIKDEAAIKNFYTKFAQKPVTYSGNHDAIYALYVKDQFNPPSEGIRLMGHAGEFACGNDSECGNDYQSILGWMQTNNDRNSLPDVWIKLGSDPHALAAASLAMLRVLDRYENAKAGHPPAEGDFFTDVQSSFESCGETQAQCKELAWDFIAIYATRGARAEPLLQNSDAENKPIFVAEGLIASMLSYLDQIRLATAKIHIPFPPRLKRPAITPSLIIFGSRLF